MESPCLRHGNTCLKRMANSFLLCTVCACVRSLPLLGDGRRLSVFEKGVLRRIFAPKAGGGNKKRLEEIT